MSGEDASSARRQQEKTRDLAWVEAARNGDRRAYAHLVEAYQKRVYAIAFGVVRHREDAWDVAQEAFVKAYKHLDRFEGSAAFYTWLYRITTNLAIDHIRERKRKRTEPLEEAPPVRAPEDHRADPEAAVDRAELGRILADAMDQLSEKHRAIIVLREVEGLSYEEMAEVLGIAKGTVMSRLFHARQKLQEILRPYVHVGETDGLRISVRSEDGGTA
ncbi:MAG: RNA polymerase sigma factor [Myxococcota bacterium]